MKVYLSVDIEGVTGITAWGGIHGVLEPQPGETLFVNAAAGAVGSVLALV